MNLTAGPRLYNTLTRSKETIVPIRPGEIRMYVCGPTVYDEPHIGHLRSAFVFDLWRKWLSTRYRVIWVRNITDVDDKIIDRARNENRDWRELAGFYTRRYQEDLSRLGVNAPDYEPRATESIDDMIQMIGHLVRAGLAYPAAGSVYFEVRRFASYGSLSNQKIDQMIENWRAEPGEGKRDHLDFALWKAAREGEPSWPSPWGAGRPGWHIECSAMSGRHLGESFDIHGGGKDLVFPHHENERAQSCGAGHSFAKYWIHHGLVTIESRKMSKSLGNFVTLASVLSRSTAEVLKFFFLQSHYTQDADFSWNKMAALAEGLESVARTIEKASVAPGSETTSMDGSGEFERRFGAAMDDDLDTPGALAVLFEASHEVNRRIGRDPVAAARLAAWLSAKLGFLGLNPASASGDWEIKLGQISEKRILWRKSKNFQKADAARKKLEALGFSVEDTRESSRILRGLAKLDADCLIALDAVWRESAGDDE